MADDLNLELAVEKLGEIADSLHSIDINLSGIETTLINTLPPLSGHVTSLGSSAVTDIKYRNYLLAALLQAVTGEHLGERTSCTLTPPPFRRSQAQPLWSC